ncbi:hypothetical protein CONPUDRAFT_140422 [Coniophora puteana RWD-64-598 SS2]|uniref:Uncharacterized protein n=1 Tax=Coniophora puteana (strain RWD-64-598) TaxID=741705 RepID=R7SEN2_CONPW|nr:uncharacterized protein CONPUDRAFT_140422 [Coniophora puteana RWD-64-598 SS2]EIW74633.1 hypothetical protein CONPUDRAFT_140422 [Coniophora puteana RWD-64-598 SS2]
MPLDEAHNDFFGLPSSPLSIYHTGPAWPLPTGPQAQRVPKEARPVCIHAISSVWHELGEKIYKFFDSIELKWTSIDPVRFAEAEKEPGPLFLWVGVLPGTLSSDDAKGPGAHCKEILLEYAITDVEIAFRESVYTRYAGLRLLDHVPSVDATADVRGPFTPALGLQIAPKAFPYLEGTGCLYLCEGGESDRIFLLTARHVVLPPSQYSNELYHSKDNSMPRREVVHLGSRAFQNALEAIMDRIGHWSYMVDGYEEEFAHLGERVEGEDPKTTSNRQKTKYRLEEAEASKASVSEFHREITSLWSAESQRILGHVVYAPPISVGTGDSMCTEDWALVELNRGKFDWDTFRGNVIHLGSKLTPYQFMKKMYPHALTRAKYKYPPGGLMQLRDVVQPNELRRPAMLDANGEWCLIVVKNGAATGATLGRATGIESFVREYTGDGAVRSTAREIAVYAYSNGDGAFSAPGDSGSVVGEASCGIVGMIIGGAGQADLTDVTYVSGYASLDECIKKPFPRSYLFPICNPTQV